MKPVRFFFHGQHCQRYSSRASPTTTTAAAAAAVEVSHQYGDLSYASLMTLDIGYWIFDKWNS